jgi:hypothetical protein
VTTAGVPLPALAVKELGAGRYQVVDPNGSGEPHLVDGSETPPTCDCRDHRFRRMRCKHVQAVEQFLLAAPIDLVPIGPGLEHDVPPPDPEVEAQPAGDTPAAPAGSNGRPAADAPFVRTLAQLLEDPDALRPPEATVPRLGYRGRTTLLFAREKAGKSTLMTAGAAALTRGVDFLGERCSPRSALWVSADQEHASEIAQRAVRFGADPARFHVLWPRAPFADLMAVLDGLHPFPGLIVIDTLAAFASTLVSDPSQSAEWPDVLLPLVRVARDLDVAVVIDHHAKKGEGGGYRDSTAIGALVDLLLEVRVDAGNLARRNVTALGRWPIPNFTLDLVGDRYQVVAGNELSLDARILLYVEQHPGTSLRMVRDHVGGRAEDTGEAMARLIARGAVTDVSTASNKHEYVAGAAAAEPSEDPDAPPF